MLTEQFLVPFPWSSVWGYNEFRSSSRPNHEGIDFGPGLGVWGGEGIPAANDARVLFAGWGGNWMNSPGYGNLVVLDHGRVNGDLLWTLYAHMRTLPVVDTGDQVTRGQFLGRVGETGNARGEHLHFECWVNESPINPRTFIDHYNQQITAYGGGTGEDDMSAKAEEQIEAMFQAMFGPKNVDGGAGPLQWQNWDGDAQAVKYGLLPIVIHNQTLIAQNQGKLAAIEQAIEQLSVGSGVTLDMKAIQDAAERGARDALSGLVLRADES